MRELIDPQEEKVTIEQASRHKELILPNADLSDAKNLAIMRYNLKTIDERLRLLEAKEG